MGLTKFNAVLPSASEAPRVDGGCALLSSEGVST
jgi:hypothetical protein